MLVCACILGQGLGPCRVAHSEDGVARHAVGGVQCATGSSGRPEAGADAGPATIRLAKAVELFIAAANNGVALNKHGRRYKPSAVRDLQGCLENHVKPALGAKRLGDVRRGDCQRLVDDVAPGTSGSRVRSVVNSIRSLYRWAQDRDLVQHDPAALVRLPAMDATPRDRVATPAEMAALLAALPLHDALPYAIASYATARRAEIRHALIGGVDFDLEVIYLGADEGGRKSRAARRAVPLVRPLALLMRRCLMARGRPADCELLCPGHRAGGQNSGRLSFEALQVRADEAWGRAKLQRITAHERRHTCTAWLDAAGCVRRSFRCSRATRSPAPSRKRRRSLSSATRTPSPVI